MPTVILKKTFKVKPAGFQVAHEKSFSFHGNHMTEAMVGQINHVLATKVRFANGANRAQFGYDQKAGHFKADMNHECQKHYEEDIICAILDTLESMGWNFRFQYDSENSSERVSGASYTSRELFMFHKRLETVTTVAAAPVMVTQAAAYVSKSAATNKCDEC